MISLFRRKSQVVLYDARDRPIKPPERFLKNATFWQAVQALAGVALLVVTVVLARYAIKQWRTMNATFKEVKKQTKSSEDAAAGATSAAGTASDSLKLTRDVLEAPFVQLESLTPYNFPDGATPGLTLVFRNYGRTPAMNVVGNATIGFRQTLEQNLRLDPVGKFVFAVIPGMETRNRWIVAPNFQQERVGRLGLPGVRFIIFGYVSYEDSGGNEFPRREFCLYYNPQPGRPEATGLFDYCTEGHNQ